MLYHPNVIVELQQFFLNCEVYNKFRSQKIDISNLLHEDATDEEENFILETKLLNKTMNC